MYTNIWKNFKHNTNGSIAPTFAIASVAVVGMAGAAVDYGHTISRKADLQAAADSAALTAARYALEHNGGAQADIVKQAKKEALKVWRANLNKNNFLKRTQPVFELKKTVTGWSAEAKYDAKVKMTLLGVVGVETLRAAGMATASAEFNSPYWDIYFAVDNSSSMGLGASKEIQDRMQADPQIVCTFACHMSSSPAHNSYVKAKKNGHRLRLDVVDDAVDFVVGEIQKERNLEPLVGLYTANQHLQEVVQLTSYLNNVVNHEIELVDIDDLPGHFANGNSDIQTITEELTETVGNSGDGRNRSSAKKLAVLITDGIHDIAYDAENVEFKLNRFRYMGPMGKGFCDEMKDNGVTVAVLHVPIVIQEDHMHYIEPYEDKIEPRLEACASDGYFASAASESEIKSSLQKLVATALATKLRLTH